MARNYNKKIKNQEAAVKKASPKPKRATGKKKNTTKPKKSAAPSRKKIEKPEHLVVLEPVREEPVKVPEKEKKSNRFILKFGIGALCLIVVIFVGSKILNNHGVVNTEKDEAPINSREVKKPLQVDREKAEKAAPPVIKKQNEKAAPKEEAGTKANTYTVNRGDTLAVVSKKLYNDYALWKKIFDANRDIISNPDEIYPGQKIKIPK